MLFPPAFLTCATRPEDIPSLVWYFTDKYGRWMGKRIETIPARALPKLMGWY